MIALRAATYLQSVLARGLVRNIGQNVATSAFLLGITLFTTPLMTRVFPPDAYGVNGMMIRGATIVSGIGLLGLPIALARQQGGPEQMRLLIASLLMGGVLSVVSAVGWFILPRLIPGVSWAVVALFPALVFFYCLNLTTRSFGTANGLFSAMANGRLGDGLGGRGLSLLGGIAIHAGALTMLLADILGKTIGAVFIARSGRDRLARARLPARNDFSRLVATVRDYREHAIYSNLATVLPTLAVFIVEASIARRFGIQDTGQYALANSILGMPVALIALASAPVVFHRLVAEAEKPDGRLGRLALFGFLGSAGLGAAIMTPILLFGPALFAFFFGERWRSAGDIAQILALPFIFNFSYTVLLGIFQARKTLKTWFITEALSLMTFMPIFFYSPRDLIHFSIYLAVIYLIRLCIIHAGFVIALFVDEVGPGGNISNMRLIANLKSAVRHPVDYVRSVLLQRAGTDIDRWSKHESLDPDWDERTRLMAGMVPNGSSVIEFGAARLTLPTFLGPECKYQPSDVVKRSTNTLVIDLNEPLPMLDQRYDFAVLSGVLEYIIDYNRLLAWLPSVAGHIVFSYAPVDRLGDPITRARHGWINHLRETEILKAIRSADLILVEKTDWRRQIIFKCRSARRT